MIKAKVARLLRPQELVYENLTIDSKFLHSKFLYDLVVSKVLSSDLRPTINGPCTFAV